MNTKTNFKIQELESSIDWLKKNVNKLLTEIKMFDNGKNPILENKIKSQISEYRTLIAEFRGQLFELKTSCKEASEK